MRKRIISFIMAAVLTCSAGVQASAAAAEETAENGMVSVAAEDPELVGVGAAQTFKAQISKMEILLDGETVKPSGYLISQGDAAYTYFKLRDIAYLMRNKECKFSVSYDSAARKISVKRGAAYQADGSEMKPATEVKNAVASSLPVLIDGKETEMEAFNINGFTYYKLRDMGENLGFEVDYRNSSKQGVIKTPGYVEPEPEPEPEPQPEPKPEPEPEPEPDFTEHLDGKLTILLDVGHGGSDSGSTGIAPVSYVNYKGETIPAGGKLLEKDFNLPVALYLRDMLEASGATVIMTRETDEYVSFAARKEMIEDNADVADLCFSVHHNAYNTKAQGFELLAQIQYKNGGAGKELGAVMEKHYTSIGRIRHRPTVFREGQNGDYYAILRYAANVDMLGMISEYAFIDNADDVQAVLSDAGLRAEAQAMHDGILEYFTTHEY